MNAMKQALLAALCLFSVCNTALAGLVGYKFSVTAPLFHGTETIGGASSPVEFHIILDPTTPDRGNVATNGLYTTDEVSPSIQAGSANVSISGVASQMSYGQIAVQNAPFNDGISSSTLQATDDLTFLGRSIFMSTASIWNFAGTMFSGIALPTTATWLSAAEGGYFAIKFRPKESDPEFGNGQLVEFSAFVSRSDIGFSLAPVATVPEQSTLWLLTAGLLTLPLIRRLKTRFVAQEAYPVGRGDAEGI